ncbi:hypothetical protein [Clostridium estertheticum]|uniref:hypothetical protein n=1 Tax=Clostridium estertheticum TaxID=238834 RepID=UPI001C0CD447|nr:hypothetical protein [Clostridium estertheticum]MBU3187915.1 hypothetical protein [Clostridium estertheticum]
MKNLTKILSVLVLALGIFIIMPKTEVYAAPPATPVTHYEITGMTDQDGFNKNEFYNFPGNAIETDDTIYIATNQLGQGKVDITLDGISRNFQEVKSTPIIETTSYGRVVAGWNNVYKIDGLTIGMHTIKFTCSGTNSPYTVKTTTATVNKL